MTPEQLAEEEEQAVSSYSLILQVWCGQAGEWGRGAAVALRLSCPPPLPCLAGKTCRKLLSSAGVCVMRGGRGRSAGCSRVASCRFSQVHWPDPPPPVTGPREKQEQDAQGADEGVRRHLEEDPEGEEGGRQGSGGVALGRLLGG